MVKLYDRRERTLNHDRGLHPKQVAADALALTLRTMRLARRAEGPKAPRAQQRVKKRTHRNYTAEEQAKMISLRYGGDLGYGYPVRTFKEVAEIMGCRAPSVWLVVKRFMDNGCQCAPDGRRQKPLDQAFVKKITTHKVLSGWAHLSLRRRVELLKRKYPGTHVNFHVLRRIYKSAGVAYNKRDKIPWKSAHRANIAAQRKQYAVELSQFIAEGREIIWLDEVSVFGGKPQWRSSGRRLTSVKAS